MRMAPWSRPAAGSAQGRARRALRRGPFILTLALTLTQVPLKDVLVSVGALPSAGGAMPFGVPADLVADVDRLGAAQAAHLMGEHRSLPRAAVLNPTSSSKPSPNPGEGF